MCGATNSRRAKIAPKVKVLGTDLLAPLHFRFDTKDFCERKKRPYPSAKVPTLSNCLFWHIASPPPSMIPLNVKFLLISFLSISNSLEFMRTRRRVPSGACPAYHIKCTWSDNVATARSPSHTLLFAVRWVSERAAEMGGRGDHHPHPPTPLIV